VTGTNFAPASNTSAEWQDDKGNAIPGLVPTVTVQSATQLILDQPAAATPTLHPSLILTSPLGLKVSKKL
jgi:hypothetical protein